MTTALVIGPTDHGRPLTLEEFKSARWQEGSRYELIDGRLYVSPLPNLPHDRIKEWIADCLRGYARDRPEVINYVTPQARVIVPDRPEVTQPEPDLAAFHDFPRNRPIGQVQWEDVSPLLVVEVVSADDPDKDLVRNVELYLPVPSVREYWIIDPREDADRPTMQVYRRRGRRWQRVIDLAHGDTYKTGLLPGFTLRVDPHWQGTETGENGR
jgi:Uma2 family endonuclease